MSIPFAKFPLLVQLKVLKQLEYPELFWLSVCSEKMKKTMKYVDMRAEKIAYSLDDDKYGVYVEYREKKWHMAEIKIVRRLYKNKKIVKVNLGGEQLECVCLKGFREDRIAWSLSFIESPDNSLVTLFYNHISSLIQNTPQSVQLGIHSVDLFPSLDIIKNVTDIITTHWDPNTTSLENYLTNQPLVESIHIDSGLSGPPFTSESKVMKIKGVGIHLALEMTSSALENFDGSHLAIRNGEWNLETWRSLIRKWKNKEAYGNLVGIFANLSHDIPAEFRRAEFLEEIGAVMFDGQRRPQRFNWDSRIMYYNEMVFDCLHYKDIQQNGNGKWASIAFGRNQVRFFVWS
ncbi:hypothetical protein GCK72_004211 [Caenorhabditis remanei]|uniref:F-box domain-containing protein n=1 Tax=Caenorhabditis remanei TaxID=31234 RepID=A0A6A5HBT5_CAERE|nr:hypothetical protein GCK72_004211 [Caenorhabditis remanei]KAF1764264.1 hypothetical protein GCK72_004211 [Caenorhabditis remanei]